MAVTEPGNQTQGANETEEGCEPKAELGAPEPVEVHLRFQRCDCFGTSDDRCRLKSAGGAVVDGEQRRFPDADSKHTASHRTQTIGLRRDGCVPLPMRRHGPKMTYKDAVPVQLVDVVDGGN